MHRRQQERLERRRPDGGSAAKSGRGWVWLLGVVVVLGGLGAFGVRFYQSHQARIMQAALQVTAAAVESKLNATRGRFPYGTGEELETILGGVRTLSLHPRLDARAAGQLRFVLGALEEMVRDGNVQSEEIGKLDNMVIQVRSYLQRTASSQSANRP